MSSMAKLLNKPRPFTFHPPGADKPLTLMAGERCLDIGAAFEAWLEDRAFKAVQRRRDKVPPHEYQALLSGWRQEAAAGEYELGMPLFYRTMASPSGQKEMTFLTLDYYNQGLSTTNAQGIPSPAVTREMIDALFDDEAKWSEWCELNAALNDPNSRRPTEAETPTAPVPPAPAA